MAFHIDKLCKKIASAIGTIKRVKPPEGGGGTPLYRLYMCGPKGYGFSAVLVINRVSILADFGHFGHK